MKFFNLFILCLFLFISPLTAEEGPSGFPLPAGAVSDGAAPGGQGKIVIYKIPRPITEVESELRDALKKGEWSIDSEKKSPRGTLRLQVSKGETKIGARLLGDTEQSGLILTLP